MSMETYEALTSPAPLPPPPGNSEGLRFLTEKPPVWAGMLADVLEHRRSVIGLICGINSPPFDVQNYSIILRI